MLRCCYVNEADPTKPLLGIFAIKTIYSGDEITLSYTGQLNLGAAYCAGAQTLRRPKNMLINQLQTEWDLESPEEKERATKEARDYRRYLDKLGERNCWCSAPRCTGNMWVFELCFPC